MSMSSTIRFTASRAMLIARNQATLDRLPPSDETWKWSDVVEHYYNDDPEPVDASVACRLRDAGLLVKGDDGKYHTSRRLERYLRERHDIDLREGDEQC